MDWRHALKRTERRLAVECERLDVQAQRLLLGPTGVRLGGPWTKVPDFRYKRTGGGMYSTSRSSPVGYA